MRAPRLILDVWPLSATDQPPGPRVRLVHVRETGAYVLELHEHGAWKACTTIFSYRRAVQVLGKAIDQLMETPQEDAPD